MSAAVLGKRPASSLLAHSGLGPTNSTLSTLPSASTSTLPNDRGPGTNPAVTATSSSVVSAPPAKRPRGRPRTRPRPHRKLRLSDLPSNILELVGSHLLPVSYTSELGWPDPLLMPYSVGKARISPGYGQKARQGNVPDTVRDLQNLARTCRTVRNGLEKVVAGIVDLKLGKAAPEMDRKGKGKGKGKEESGYSARLGGQWDRDMDSLADHSFDEAESCYDYEDDGESYGSQSATPGQEYAGSDIDMPLVTPFLEARNGGLGAGERARSELSAIMSANTAETDLANLDEAEKAARAGRQEKKQAEETRQKERKRRDELDDDSEELSVEERRDRHKRVTMYIHLVADTQETAAQFRKEIVQRRHQLEEIVFHKCPHEGERSFRAHDSCSELRRIAPFQRDISRPALPNLRRLRFGPQLCTSCLTMAVDLFLSKSGPNDSWDFGGQADRNRLSRIGPAAPSLQVLEINLTAASSASARYGYSEARLLNSLYSGMDVNLRKQLEALHITFQDHDKSWTGLGPFGTCREVRMKEPNEVQNELEAALLAEQEAARVKDKEVQAARRAARAKKAIIRPPGLSKIPERKRALLEKYAALATELKASGKGGEKLDRTQWDDETREDLLALSSELVRCLRGPVDAKKQGGEGGGKAAGDAGPHTGNGDAKKHESAPASLTSALTSLSPSPGPTKLADIKVDERRAPFAEVRPNVLEEKIDGKTNSDTLSDIMSGGNINYLYTRQLQRKALKREARENETPEEKAERHARSHRTSVTACVHRQRMDLETILSDIASSFPNIQALQICRANGYRLDVVSGEWNKLAPVDEYVLPSLSKLRSLKWLDLGLVVATEDEVGDFPFGVAAGSSRRTDGKKLTTKRGKNKKNGAHAAETEDDTVAERPLMDEEKSHMRRLWLKKVDEATEKGDKWRDSILKRMVLGERKDGNTSLEPERVTLPAGVRSGWVWMVDLKERGRKRGLVQHWKVQGIGEERQIKWGEKQETTL